MPEQQTEVKEVSIDTLPMSEFIKARTEGKTAIPAESAAKPAAQEQDKEVPEAQETSAETGSESETERPREKAKPKGGFQQRIDKLTKRNRTIEDENATLKRELESLRKPQTEQRTQQVQKDPNAEPKREDFASEIDFVRAMTRWEVRQENERSRQAESQRQQEETTKQVFDSHYKRVSEARGRIEDFDEVIEDSGIEISKEAAMAIYECENSADVMYHLAKNPEDAETLKQLSPIRQIAAIGHISASLGSEKPSRAPKKLESTAPAPITPVGGASSKSSVPLDQSDIHSYMKARQAGRMR